MKSSKLVRIALALVVGGSGAAMYATNALAHPACPIVKLGTVWNSGSACCTASNGKNACAWGELGSGGVKVMKATADGPPPPPVGFQCPRWRADALDQNAQPLNPACVLTSDINGTFVGIGNTAAASCSNNGATMRISVSTFCPP